MEKRNSLGVDHQCSHSKLTSLFVDLVQINVSHLAQLEPAA